MSLAHSQTTDSKSNRVMIIDVMLPSSRKLLLAAVAATFWTVHNAVHLFVWMRGYNAQAHTSHTHAMTIAILMNKLSSFLKAFHIILRIYASLYWVLVCKFVRSVAVTAAVTTECKKMKERSIDRILVFKCFHIGGGAAGSSSSGCGWKKEIQAKTKHP